MTCNCQPSTPTCHDRLRIAACVLCPHADTAHSPYSVGVIGCTLNGQSIVQRMHGASCPLDRIDANGNVRWLGVLWYGLPMLHRLWLWAFHPSHPKPSTWDGCGCIKVLKDLYERLLWAS